ncbi:Glutamate/aspartate import solute-binding protein [Burkholderia puraquae]|uniref:Glutamate/aspartate import solute-binding protein n=1 Tax=Burkholderia puraquae TaxID=1904757 RepID=A0A6J5F1Z6_9BURK|nr:Glutamate/aspartate import solute-binding protein [Burkholderia puraquae]
MPFPSRFAARFGRPMLLVACALACGAPLAAEPADWQSVGTPQSSEAYGFMLRKDDPAFKALVDGVLVQLMRRGKIDALYDKWLMKPVPPKRLSGDFAMSDVITARYAAPNDAPLE